MKKNFLFYLLMMAFPITFFSACGDDKDDNGGGITPPPAPPTPAATTWKDGVGAYKTGDASTILKINGEDPKESTKSVTLATGSGDNAKITLTNLVPDDAAVEFDNVEMTKSGNDYAFSSEATVGTTTITLSGTLSGIPATKADEAKTLDIQIARKINSPVAGTWNLHFTERGAGVAFDVSTGDPANDIAIPQILGSALGGMLAQKVSDVTATFTEDGIFDVTWINQGETEPTGMPEGVKQMVEIMYFASDSQVFIALNKTLIPMLEMLASSKFDIKPLLDSMIDKGDYAALPLNIKTFSGRVPQADVIPEGYTFFIEREMVLAALPSIVPMLDDLGQQMPPELGDQVVPMLKNLPEIIANSEIFNVGLNFVEKKNLIEK
ncbi:MAG: hypothetical protein LBF62_01475 [Tannerellaceae bacterium]|nr:hypothetical protein [Tannerellaceae bacterium]